MSVVRETHFPDLSLFRRGKVRDVYDLGDQLLLVATDRISAFDVVMNEPVPQKGEILTRISAFWFQKTQGIIPNHLITTDVSRYPEPLQRHKTILDGRSMLVHKTKALPLECIVRGYVSGSGWKDYKRSGRICGIELPVGLQESERLAEPIFTPSTKAESGHDQNISFRDVESQMGGDVARRVRDTAIQIYLEACRHAESRGVIIADTKMEFGIRDGQLVLIDELLTPDSSRFWPADDYQPGRAQRSFDKQFLRDYLLSLDWNQMPPPPPLPVDILTKTMEKYMDVFRRLTE